MKPSALRVATACFALFAAAIFLTAQTQAESPQRVQVVRAASISESLWQQHAAVLRNARLKSGPQPRGISYTAPTWKWTNPAPSGDSFLSVAYGNSIYVAVGNDGAIFSSTDGTHWAAQSTSVGIGGLFDDIIYAGGQFLASAQVITDNNGTYNSSFLALTSTDGVHWTQSTVVSPTSSSGYAYGDNLAYGNSTYVAVGNAAFTSPDGQTWTEHNISSIDPSTSTIVFEAPVFGNATFVTLGIDAANNLAPNLYYSSDNGSTWNAATITVASGDVLGGVAWNGSTFVAVGIDYSSSCNGGNGCGLVFTSPDGKTWTQQADVAAATNGLFSVLATGSSFVANGFTSTDGINWSQSSAPNPNSAPDPLQAIQYSHTALWTGAQFIAVNNAVNSNTMLSTDTSPDYVNWTTASQASGPITNLYDAVYINNQYMILGNTLGGYNNEPGDDVVLTSPDGLSWTQTVIDTNNSGMRGIAWSGSEYVVVGSSIATSSDGKTWSEPGNLGYTLNDVSYGNSEFVAVGNKLSGPSGVIQTSTDGKTWVTRTSPTPDYIEGVVWDSTAMLFVAVTSGMDCAVGSATGCSGDGIFIITSPDGVNWTSASVTAPTGTILELDRVRVINGVIYAVGANYAATNNNPTSGQPNNGVIVTSSDGVTWTVNTPTALGGQSAQQLTDIAWNGNEFFATGSYIAASTDASTWTADPGLLPATQTSLNSITSNGAQLVAVGQDGNIIDGALLAPTAINGSLTTSQNTAVNGTLTESGTGSLTFAIVSQPSHGTVTLTNASTGTFTYTPANNFTGNDSFTFNVSGSAGTSNTATESVTITVPVPAANNGSVTATENTAANGTLSASGTGPLTFAIVSQPAHGTVTLTNASTGAFTYTPNMGFSGSDSFTFTAGNSGGTSNTATETITVASPPPPPPPGGGGSGGGGGGGGLGLLGLFALAGLYAKKKLNK